MFKLTISLFSMVCLFLFFIGSAQAVNSVEVIKLKKCAEVSDADKRLDCFNKVIEKEYKPVRDIITKNMEQSYITFGAGFDFGADQTRFNMIYEGQVFKNISWDDGRIICTNRHYWLDVPIRIGVRQLTETSMPVRTPSFNPGLRMYWYEDGEAEKNGPEFPLTYYSFGLHHYSNGQEGVSTNVDGTVNKVDGSFNTNYAEGAVHWAWADGLWLRTAFRQHFFGTFEDFQHDQYPRRHLSVELQSPTWSEHGCLKWTCDYQLKMTETYKHGYKYLVKNDVNPAMNVEAKTTDKFDTTLEVIVKPKSWDEMSLYLRYDYGYDYYNINFQNRMNRLQIGLIGKIF